MKTTTIIFFYFNLLLLVPFLQAKSQDRDIKLNEVYPPESFIENGGRFINVQTSLSYLEIGPNAKGDGATDDSEAIIAAMDWVMDRLKEHYASGGGVHWQEHWFIYFPKGTYLVSKSLHYSGNRVIDPIFPDNSEREGTQNLMLIGENRENTIIKLKDNTSGFGVGASVPVVSFSRFDLGTVFNNMPAGFQFRNLTINTGSGNPGAIGLDYYGANTSRLDNIKITGDGEIGLHIRMGSAHGYYSNIIVDGMNYGIYLEGNEESHPTIEYVTLKNQGINSIYLESISVSMRKVSSTNSVTGMRMGNDANGKRPHMVITDSEFKNGNSSNNAIQIDGGYLFSRNINIQEYGSAVKKGSNIEHTGSIKEYISEPITTFSPSRVRDGDVKSMNLPIKEYPNVSWVTDFNEWANVQDYGAVGDGSTNDASAIQAAMNSGKSVVYFPKDDYKIGSTVNIPASVKFIIMGNAGVPDGGTKFNINESSSEPLVLSGLNLRGGEVKQTAVRNVLFEHNSTSAANFYQSELSSGGTELYVNCSHGFARSENTLTNVDVWARYLNNEKGGNNQFSVDNNSTLWIMGFKSEKTYTVFRAANGSMMEVLGGLLNRWSTDVEPDVKGIYNDNSNISITCASNGPKRDWSPMVQDVQGGKTKEWAMSHFPSRGWDNNIVIPLYTNYDPAAVPEGDSITFINCR